MKIYFHLVLEGFTNCYVVVNDDPDVMEAIIIDPGKITNQIITQIESSGYKLTGVLITHNHTNHVKGLSTLCKIYSPQIFASEQEILGFKTNVIRGDGTINVAGLNIQHWSLPGHTADSMVFKIEDVLFTGDTLFAGSIGETTSRYSKKLLRDNLNEKIMSQIPDTVVMPGHGPPTTIQTEKMYNIDLSI